MYIDEAIRPISKFATVVNRQSDLFNVSVTISSNLLVFRPFLTHQSRKTTQCFRLFLVP
jgi:hypothetical protein